MLMSGLLSRHINLGIRCAGQTRCIGVALGIHVGAEEPPGDLDGARLVGARGSSTSFDEIGACMFASGLIQLFC